MTFREFTGKNVEEAIRAAMAEFSADLGDLDIEILAQGSRGILGVGGEEARILAAPKSAVASRRDGSRRCAGRRADARHRAGARHRGDARRRVMPDAPVPATPQPSPQPDALRASRLPTDADDQVAELAARRVGQAPRVGRAAAVAGRNGREREHAIREPARSTPAGAPWRPPEREPAPFVSGKPSEELSEAERATLDTAKTVLDRDARAHGAVGHRRDRPRWRDGPPQRRRAMTSAR